MSHQQPAEISQGTGGRTSVWGQEKGPGRGGCKDNLLTDLALSWELCSEISRAWAKGSRDHMTARGTHTPRWSFTPVQYCWAVSMWTFHGNQSVLMTSSQQVEQGSRKHPHRRKLLLPRLIRDRIPNIEVSLIWILMWTFNDVIKTQRLLPR